MNFNLRIFSRCAVLRCVKCEPMSCTRAYMRNIRFAAIRSEHFICTPNSRDVTPECDACETIYDVWCIFPLPSHLLLHVNFFGICKTRTICKCVASWSSKLVSWVNPNRVDASCLCCWLALTFCTKLIPPLHTMHAYSCCYPLTPNSDNVARFIRNNTWKKKQQKTVFFLLKNIYL